MADVSFTNLTNLPPEIATNLENINRKRRIQDALLAQTLQRSGRTQMTGGKYSRAVPYSPWEGATKLIQAAMLSKASDRNNQALTDLGQRFKQDEATAVEDVLFQARGRPESRVPNYNESPQVSSAYNMGTGPIVPGVEPDPMGAITTGAGSPYQGAQRVSDAMMDMRGLDRTKDRGSYWTQVPTRDGKIMLMNTRTGDLKDSGQYAAKYDIPTTEKLSGAKTKGSAEATRKFNMSGIGQVIERARNLMSGVNPETGEIDADKPTESGVGAAYDWLSAVVGHSPTGAKEATALKALGGALTAKMPRMEGPQSDKDTLLYREMAAQIGDKTIPLDQRIFALQEVERIWAKYEDLNQDIYNEGATAPPKGFTLD